METHKTNQENKEGDSQDCVSSTRMYKGKNNEFICVKIYKGDWGDWDEKPPVRNEEISQEGENDKLHIE